MKKTNQENIVISREIESILPINFEDVEFSLDGWGEADNYTWLNSRTLILLECEKSQKHPNTNVLKVWPYLEKNTKIKLILFHYFFRENKAPKNRVALCGFTGEKLENQFKNRFQYVPLNDPIRESLKENLITELKGIND